MDQPGDRSRGQADETGSGSGAAPPPWRDRRRVLTIGKRLAVREYLPFGAWTVAWLMIGLAVGHADAVRLLAANTFVGATRALLTMEVMQVLARRVGSEAAVYRASRQAALRIDLWALAACLLAIALLVGFLLARDMRQAALMTGIAALSIPARHPLSLLIARRDRDLFWRLGAAAVSLVGGAIVLALGLHWMAAAAVLAARDWGGLIATLLFAPRRPDRMNPATQVLSFGETATKTEGTARKRLSYRMMKSVFGVVLGPFGNLAARTGRSAGGLDVRLANMMPRSRPGMVLLAGGTGAGALSLLLLSREPAALLGAAALLRIAGSAGAILLWWNYADAKIEVEEDEDD